MTFDTFLASIDAHEPPHGLPAPLAAIWLGLNDRWGEAHGLVQDLPGPQAAWVHAWLHRIEGDDWNAGYWYRQAGRAAPEGPTDAEGADIARALLGAR